LKLTKKWMLFSFTFYVLTSPVIHTIHAAPIVQQTLKRIAVLDLQGAGVEATAAQTLTDRLRSRLVNTGAFHVLERDQMDEILTEQGFQQSGCVSDECLVEIGRLVGVEQMIGGSIGKIGSTYTLDLRIIDVTTGRIIKTVSDDYRGDADGLLGILGRAAQKIAGQAETQQGDGESSTWYYWAGAGVLIAGAIAVLAGGSSGGGSKSSDLPGLNGENGIKFPER